MFEKYIRNIVKEEIDYIRLEKTLKPLEQKTYWEDHFKCKLKHIEKLFKETDEENNILKDQIIELNNQIKKLHIENNELSEKAKTSYNESIIITLENHNQQEIEMLKGEKEVLQVALKLSEDHIKLLEECENEKLTKISDIVNSDNEQSFYGLMYKINNIKDILKER